MLRFWPWWASLLMVVALATDEKKSSAEEEKLKRGRASYQTACARCHGEDGDWDHYPGIKKVGGIGKRLTQKEILERLRPLEITPDEIAVRGHILSRKDLDELITYVASL